MKRIGGPIRAAVLAAAAGTGVAIPAYVRGGGYWHAPGPPPSHGLLFDDDAWEVPEWNSGLRRLLERRRKEPFEHYAHNPDDLRLRPICPPVCEPRAGYFEPGWRQLPAGPGDPPIVSVPSIVPAPAHPQLVPPPAPPETVPPMPNSEGNGTARPPAAPPADEYDPPPQTGAGPSLVTPAGGWRSVSSSPTRWKPFTADR